MVESTGPARRSWFSCPPDVIWTSMASDVRRLFYRHTRTKRDNLFIASLSSSSVKALFAMHNLIKRFMV
jgi:hypothetical protein